MAERTSVPGVSTGLAWTPVGGDILFVEGHPVLWAGPVANWVAARTLKI